MYALVNMLIQLILHSGRDTIEDELRKRADYVALQYEENSIALETYNSAYEENDIQYK